MSLLERLEVPLASACALDEQCAVSGRGGSLEYAGAMNAAADDDHIVFFHLH